MEERIIDTAGQYAQLAQMLKSAAEDDNAPEDIHRALLRLYDVTALESKMQKCREQLGEDSDGDTVEAVLAAARAMEEAADAVFGVIERYSAAHADFEETIEGIAWGSGGKDIDDLLRKLYKCEGIIRLAYRSAMRHPTYGVQRSIWGGLTGTEPIGGPEEVISGDMGVDIYALLDIKERLVEMIGALREAEK